MSQTAIILAAYNSEQYIGEQIDSILRSKNQNFHIFAFDDGSTDHTIEILNRYTEKVPKRVSVDRNPQNLGYVKNFLCGLREIAIKTKQTETQYFMFCDHDDVWHEDKISVTLARMKQMEERYGKEVPAMVFTDASVVNRELESISPSFMRNSHLNPRKTDLAHLLMENKCIGCTIMMNRALVELLQDIPEQARFHDWWMALLAASFGHISFLAKSTLDYRQHGDNEVGSESFVAYIKERISKGKEQKQRLLQTQKQAEEFFRIYRKVLPIKKRILIRQFASLSQYSPWKRRDVMLKNRFFKSGFLRNIGVFLQL